MTIFLEGGDIAYVIGDIFVPMVMICVKVQWHYLSYSSEIKLEHNHWNDFASIAVLMQSRKIQRRKVTMTIE